MKPSRAVQCIRKIKEVLPTVTAIPAASCALSEVLSFDAGAPGIYLEVGAAATFSGQTMAGAGPSQVDMTIPFAIVLQSSDLTPEEPATSMVEIAEAIRLEFEARIIAGDFRGYGAIYLDAWACEVQGAELDWPVISGSFRVQGFQ